MLDSASQSDYKAAMACARTERVGALSVLMGGLPDSESMVSLVAADIKEEYNALSKAHRAAHDVWVAQCAEICTMTWPWYWADAVLAREGDGRGRDA